MIPHSLPSFFGVDLTFSEHHQALRCAREMCRTAPLPTLIDNPPRRYLPCGWRWRCIYAERCLDATVRLIFAIYDPLGVEHYRRAVRLIERKPLRLVSG